MKNPSFEDIQDNMILMLNEFDVKSGTNKAYLLERAYIRALRDADVEIPIDVGYCQMSELSVIEYKNTKRRPILPYAQLGFDDSDGTYTDGYKA